MKHILFTICFLLALVGCATQPEIRYVPKVETTTIVLSPPSALYAPVKRVKPPNIKDYVQANWTTKETILYDHIHKLDIQIEALFIDRTSTGKWVAEQTKNAQSPGKP